MIDAELVSLLQCPQTGLPLVLDENTASIDMANREILSGQLALAGGQPLGAPVQALLRSSDSSSVYPVSADVLSLLPDYALVAANGATPTPTSGQSRRNTEIQRQQMQQYSDVYERWTGGENGITRALQKGLHQRFRKQFTGASVLDVGNGGTTAETQLGAELASVITRFIAVDKSPDMLGRSGLFGDQILGDAFSLPFKSNAVDVVMVNNTLHHFGLRRGASATDKIQAFFTEALRVTRRGIIGVELLVPTWGEILERLLLYPAGFMPTFVYSASFYKRTLPTVGGHLADFEVRKLSQLTSPWRIIPPVLDHTWLRVPTFVIPYSFLFFYIEK